MTAEVVRRAAKSVLTQHTTWSEARCASIAERIAVKASDELHPLSKPACETLVAMCEMEFASLWEEVTERGGTSTAYLQACRDLDEIMGLLSLGHPEVKCSYEDEGRRHLARLTGTPAKAP